jgi:sugar (pentulose or hexulose) kinase
MKQEVLMGVDVGTTYCKAGIIDLHGHELACVRVPTPWEAVPTGAEIPPHRLVDIVLQVARAVLGQVPNAQVLGIGFTSMAEAGVLLDRHGEPLAPAIAWHDRRGEAEAQEIATTFGTERFTLQTGLPVSRLCSLAKLRWLTTRNAELRHAWRWLTISEWIAFALGAEPVAEYSLATRTGLLALRTQQWWEEAVAWLGFARTVLPPLVAAGTPIGRVKSGVLPGAEHAVLSIGGHDHPCAAIGAGALHPETLLDSNGTAEALVRAVPPTLSDDQILRACAGGVTVGWHAIPGAWSLLGGILGGKALNRFLHLLGRSEGAQADLDAMALALPPGEPLPHITGMTADEANLLGIGWNVGPAHIWRAAHEALAQEALQIRRVMEQVAGPVKRTVAVGGWTRSPLVRQVKSLIFGEVEYPNLTEAGVRGAALMAGLAAGVYPTFWALPPLPAHTG